MTKESIIKLLEIQLLEDAILFSDARQNLPGTDGYKTVKDVTTGLTMEEEVEKQADQFYFKQGEGFTTFVIYQSNSGYILYSKHQADSLDQLIFQPDPV